MLQLINIQKNYDRPVITNLTYTFVPGKLYVIKGISGCGKSTLLNIIGGVETDYDGIVSFSDNSFMPGYIFQSSLLLSKISVQENLQLINNDTERIIQLCEQLNIMNLLTKLPEQLSGGERQRVAIVRALLQSPKLLLADEPTASLDDDNSKRIAETIAQLRNEDRIIIVATHEHCFDELADEIIHLRYGVIEKVDINAPFLPHHLKEDTPVYGIDKKHFGILRYAIKRNSKLFSIGSLIPLALAFLLVMLVSTLQKNFDSEYLRIMQDRYPMDLIIFYGAELDGFPYIDDIVIYDNYTAEEDGINAYYLLNEKDSVLAIDGMIIAGRFPETNCEVLASQAFISSHFGETTNYEIHIGKQIIFKDTEFTISGVLADLSNSTIEHNLFTDIYYQRKVQDNSIFIPYDTIKNIGEKQETDFHVGVYDGLADNNEVLTELQRTLIDGKPNQFYADIKTSQAMLDGISSIFLIVLFVSYITSCIFMVSIVQTELFYRRKELGYLQVFGVKRTRIGKMVFVEYSLRIMAAFVVAAICYICAILIYGGLTGAFLIFDVSTTFVIISLLFAIYLITVSLSIYRFLRRSIISLIK